MVLEAETVREVCALSSAIPTPTASPSILDDVPEEASVTFDPADVTVMLVDDEPINIEVIEAYLEEAGYRRFVATSEPAQALDLLRSERPDVLLLDLMMPKVSGFDILAQVRADPDLRYVPVIVLTSASDPSTKLRALDKGATEFLAKPVDASELKLRVRNTLAFKAYQNRLANYDALTGLLNRRMFLARLEWTLRHAERYGRKFALLHLDLDRFKQINDTLGHNVGDALLREVARRLRLGVRDSDAAGRLQDAGHRLSLSRVGGDEFTLLVPELAKAEDASLVARRLLAAISEPILIDGHELVITASIGITVYPDDGSEQETLLKNAGIAMNHAKQLHRNSYEFYSSEINTRAFERLTLESQLRRAIERDELLVYYQPKIHVKSGAITGAEALVRWRHPELGLVSPAKFIPMAEETGLIVPIGELVLRTASQDRKAWETDGLGRVQMAVNVSSVQLKNVSRFMHTLQDVLVNCGCPPRSFAIELTESLLMDNAEGNISVLRSLREMGVDLSVDDFGTGYSSLAYLKRFPLNELKIDRTFIKDIPGDTMIVSAIVSLGRNMGLRVVAEGVETKEQLAFLKEKKCDAFQGFLVSPPVPQEKFRELLKAQTPAADAGKRQTAGAEKRT